MTIALGQRPIGLLGRVVDRRGDLRAIAIMRMLFGAIVVRHLWPDLTAEVVPVERFHVPWWPWLPTPTPDPYRALTAIGVVAGAAMSIGSMARRRRAGAIAARGGTIVALVVVSYLLFVDMTAFAHNRGFLVWMLIGLALVPAGGEGRGLLWPVTLLQIVVSSIYLTSGGTKLVNGDWRSGLVLWDRVNRYAHRIPVDGWIAEVVTSRWFHHLLAPAAIAVELFIGVALWSRRTRLAAVWLAIMFHLSIDLTADVQTFSYSAIAGLLIWVTPRTRDRALVTASPRLATVVRRLDWLARFRVEEPIDPSRGTLLVDRDGTESFARDATLVALTRLPLTFPVAGPAMAIRRLVARSTKTGQVTETRPTVHPATDSALVPIAVVGILAGLLAGLFGVGGGILIVPGLVLAARMDQRLAHGTSLAAVVPIAIASVLTYLTHGNVDWTVSLWLAIGAVSGAVIGTRLLHVLPHRTLGMLFAAIMVASAIRLFIATDAAGREALSLVGVVALVAIGLVTGILAGLLGVGGGIVMVPAMIVLFGVPPVVAKGTSLAVIVPTALMGTWRNRSRRNADLRAATIVGVAGIVTAAIGGTVSARLSDTTSNVMFAVLLTIVAARLVRQLIRQRTPRDLAEATAVDG